MGALLRSRCQDRAVCVHGSEAVAKRTALTEQAGGKTHSYGRKGKRRQLCAGDIRYSRNDAKGCHQWRARPFNTSAFVRTYMGGVIVNSRADRDHDGDKDDRGDNASSTIGAA